VLAGDGLLAEAFALLANEPDDLGFPQLVERKLRVLKRIGQALGPCGMLGGQAMDLAFVGRLPMMPGDAAVPLDETTLRDMHARKTGALIRAAASAGAIMAGGSASQVAAIDDFAADLGLAFQIVDDVLDVDGTVEAIGKTPGKDELNGKPSYPAMVGVDGSRALARACVARAECALRRGGVPAHRLMPLAEWTVARCS